MKKKLLTISAVLIGVLILLFSFINSNSATSEPALTKDEIKDIVSEQYAGEISTPILRNKNNEPVYHVDVAHDENIYHIKLNGISGEVITIDKEVNKDNKQETSNESQKENKQSNQEQAEEKDKIKSDNIIISQKKVSKIALEQFSGVIDDIDLEDKNGRLIYEVEIENGEREAEIIIDAYTGEVIFVEIDEN